MTEATAETKRPIPAWVGVAVVVLCLACGGGFLWWYLHDPLGAGEIIPDPDRAAMSSNPRPRAIARARVAQQQAASTVTISETSRGTTYSVRDTTGNIMDAEKAKSGAMSYVFRYSRKDLLTSDQKELAVIRWRVQQDTAVAQTLGITDAQIEQLKKIPSTIFMEASQSDKDKLTGQFNDWMNASNKQSAEKTLVASLTDVGNRSLDATKAKIADRVGQISAVITPEIVKKFNAMNGGTN